MISLLKKQILLLALAAGIAMPVSAMDTSSSESGFGWKTVAGVSALVGAGIVYVVYTKWVKLQTTELKEEDFVHVEPDGDAVKTGAAQTGSTVALDTKEDLQRAQNDADAEIAKLDVEIAQQQGKTAAAASTTVKRPKGQAGRRKPTGKPVKPQEAELVVEETEEVTAKAQPTAASTAPKKLVGGQTYGVKTGDLQKTQLKKTVKKAPAKK